MRLSQSIVGLDREQFVKRFGGIYEHSPWIAERVWERGLDEQHNDVGVLSEALVDVLADSSVDEQLSLIQAHPDLVGKAAVAGELTTDSTVEQSSAGLDQCTAEEFRRFTDLNTRYWQKFDFPFVMAVRNSDRKAILQAFEQRLSNTRDMEFKRAIEEINSIAELRLIAMASLPAG
ncbi:MAG: 2-oxo-4-hydroxy-4-carboxy-5-ureidoimidazoline decarboxylase [Granulosicoccus sp.]